MTPQSPGAELPPLYFAADLGLGSRAAPEGHDALLARRMLPQATDINKAAELWLLGDLSSSRPALVQFLQSIRPYWSKIHLVKGDRDDKAAWRLRAMFDSAHEAHYLKVTPTVKLYLSHYEHRVWKGSSGGSYHLHASAPSGFHRRGRSVAVSLLAPSYLPYRLKELIKNL